MKLRGVNMCILIGSISGPVRHRVLASRDREARASLITLDSWRDKRSQESQAVVDEHQVVFRGRMADAVSRRAGDGAIIMVSGTLRTTVVTDAAGVRHSVCEVRADDFQVLRDAPVPREPQSP